ncbi:hypothetical protein F5Y16DRAFT_318953 [Xylariaceae sp. FL0255]|nr:hypothetical protein F5Y16DRAFT_318953 [Xylariaceae sp. FL0255]
MFNSFYYTDSCKEPFLVKDIPPPFGKKRASKLTRLACESCRNSKLKCSGESSGCQRCRTKDIKCCYDPKACDGRPGSRRSRCLARSPNHERPLLERLSSADQNPQTVSGLGADDSQDEFVSSLDFLTNVNVLDDALVGKSNDWIAQSLSQEQIDAMALDSSNYLQYNGLDSSQTWQLSATTENRLADFPRADNSIGPFKLSDKPEELPALTGNGPTESAGPTSRSDASEFAACGCFVDALATFEFTQITLAWKQQGTALSPDNLLQSLKKALHDLERLLVCPYCVTQSGYITLLTSMSGDILSSIQTGCQYFHKPSPNHVTDANKNSDSPKACSRKISHPQCAMDDTSCQPPKCSLDANGSPDPRTVQNITRAGAVDYKILVGEWQLDNDDQTSVMQRLFLTRVSKLSKILSRLKNIAQDNKWAAQSSRLCQVEEDCYSLSLQLDDADNI